MYKNGLEKVRIESIETTTLTILTIFFGELSDKNMQLIIFARMTASFDIFTARKLTIRLIFLPSLFSKIIFLNLRAKKLDREFDDSENSHTVEVSNNGNAGFVDLCQEENKQCDRKFESITLDDEILRYSRQNMAVA